MNGTGIFLCNFSGMIKNALPSLRQRAGPQRICSRQKSIRSSTARDSFSQTPHMRGKVIVDLVLTERHRITPACAGKRCSPVIRQTKKRDHPRVCGEKAADDFFLGVGQGSPPRMRGKVRAIVDAALEGGITPACAGKSRFHRAYTVRHRDHPRVCGEKQPGTGWALS